MKTKLTAVVLVLVVAVGIAAAMRTTSRADAAPGDCYSDAKGPSEPTICS